MKNSKYQEILSFYDLLYFFILDGEHKKELAESGDPKLTELASSGFETSVEVLISIFEQVKGDISVTEFSMDTAKKVYGDFDVREDLAECAFKDLSPHLRDPQAMKVVRNYFAFSGTDTTDDIYIHVRNARPLEGNSADAAVVTVIVDSYRVFKALLDGDGPDHVHVSYSDKVSKVE